MESRTGRLFLISGRVQGVGYRAFAEHAARQLQVSGWARNLADGRVEIQALGSSRQLDDFEARLRQGPRLADVRGVEVTDAAVPDTTEFHIR